MATRVVGSEEPDGWAENGDDPTREREMEAEIRPRSAEKLPDECDWVVWIDPPPSDYVGLAFDDLHAALEQSSIKASNLERRVMDLTTKNKKLKQKLKKKNELIRTMCFVSVLGIIIVPSVVSMWSN
ncbi:hypothetical protein D1007_40452 [Hordeum vulgare]|nr:hypothetical protein D1007_40452 [Hordeum vulgare]